MKTDRFGYVSRDISMAIRRLLHYRPEWSEKNIRKYARANDLVFQCGRKKEISIIPESKLGNLLEGMKIPMTDGQLMEEIEKDKYKF